MRDGSVRGPLGAETQRPQRDGVGGPPANYRPCGPVVVKTHTSSPQATICLYIHAEMWRMTAVTDRNLELISVYCLRRATTVRFR